MISRPAIPVLEVLVSTQPGGGPEHVLALATHLGARGFAPVIAGPHDGVLFDRFGAAGLEVVSLRTDRLRAATLVRLARLIRARRIRLVHSHGKGAGLYGRLAARAAGVPAVHTFHGIHFERYPPPLRAAYLAMERALARWTAAVVNVSAVQETEGLALRLFTAAQSRVVPNGIDAGALVAGALDRGAARSELGLDDRVAVAGCVARLDPVKGLDVLVRAIAGVAGVTLVLIGRGPERSRLATLAADIGLGERVRFAGEIAGAARLLRAFDVYASASGKEGMPLAVLEAMALGLPVVASDIPAHREILGTGYAGLVERTPEALGGAIGRAFADGAWRAALAAENRRRAPAFDIGRTVDAIAALYGDLLRL